MHFSGVMRLPQDMDLRICVKLKDKGENITRYVFLQLIIRPTKAIKTEVTSTNSNAVSGKDFNSLTGLPEMKIVFHMLL